MISNSTFRFALSSLALGAAALLASLPTDSRAATKTWNLSANGNWNVGGNWNLVGVPGAGDVANVTSSTTGNFTATYDYPGPAVTLNSLTVNATVTPFVNPTLTLSMAANNLSAGIEHVGDSTGTTSPGVATFNQSGGTNRVTNTLILGFNALGQGFYNLSGTGTLNATGATEEIGLAGQGNFNHVTGTNNAANLILGVNAGSDGGYNLVGTGTLSISGDETVGSSGTGSFTQSAGTQTIVGDVSLGQGVTGSGNYSLSGGSLSTHNLYIGNAGMGSFGQGGGTNTVAGPGILDGVLSLGKNAGASGTYNLSGGTLTTPHELIGDAGTGVFTHSSGTNSTIIAPSFGDIYVGNAAGSTGTYNLSGTGVVISNSLTVGNFGNGNFNQAGGTSALTGLFIGSESSGNGTYMLSGGSLFGSLESIGPRGTGAFIQTGGINQAGSIGLGANGGNGSYTLSSGALTGGTEQIGGIGTGTFVQTGGSNTISAGNNLFIGGSRNASYSLSGAGQLFVGGGDENIGNFTGTSATAIFNQSGGQNNSNGLFVGRLGTYTLSEGDLNIVETETVGSQGGGTFNQSGGINNNVGNLVVGDANGDSGLYNLSGGILEVGSIGTPAAAVSVGLAGTGVFNQSGGTHRVGDGSRLAELRLGDAAGGNGFYTLNGTGQLQTTGDEIVGNSGSGRFTQSAGSNRLIKITGLTGGNLILGSSAGSTGSYTLSGTGVLTVDSFEFVGRFGNGEFIQTGGTNAIGGDLDIGNYGGDGTYALSGGTLSARSVQIGSGLNPTETGALTVSANAVMTVREVVSVLSTSGNSALNLNGGTINTGFLHFFGDSSQFHWTSGTVNFTSDQTSDDYNRLKSFDPVFSLGSNKTLRVLGNETLGGLFPFSMTLDSGGTHYVRDTLTLTGGGILTQNPGSTFYAGTFQMNGGIVGGTLTNQGAFHYQSGLFNGRLVNSGTVALEVPSFTLGNGLENDADITLDAAHTIVANGAGFTNFGTFTLAGGTLSGNAGAVNDFGGVMTAHGTINPAFTNNGHVTVDGALRFNAIATNSGILGGSGVVIGTFTNSPSGTVDLAAGDALSFTAPWSNAGLVVLEHATATLGGVTITNQGTIEGVGTLSAPVVNSTGVIRASGGELRLAGNGSANGSGGQIQAPAGGTVIFLNGLGNNSGVISLTGGTFDNNARQLNNGGTINGNGTLRTGSLGLVIAGGGLLSVGGGDMNVLGPVINNGTVNIQGGRTAYFFGNVNGAGVYTGAGTADFLASFSPGNSPALVDFSGNMTLGGGAAALAIEIGGAAATSFDQVHVTGQLSLGGTLAVSLIGGFSPTAGQTFDLLDWGSLVGTFATLQLPALTPGLSWNTSQLYVSGALSIVGAPQLAGDYNHNGIVDAADYTVWRDSLGRTGLGLAADGDGNGVVNTLDYDFWKSRFGTVSPGIGAGGGSLADTGPVPEPSTLILAALALVPFARRLRGVNYRPAGARRLGVGLASDSPHPDD